MTSNSILQESIELEASAAAYGVKFDGQLVGSEYHSQVDGSREYTLAELAAEGGKVSRVRVLTDGSWGVRRADISYIHATLPGGQVVRVNLNGCHSIGIRWDRFSLALIEWAKAEGVYAKGLGLLDRGNWSVMY